MKTCKKIVYPLVLCSVVAFLLIGALFRFTDFQDMSLNPLMLFLAFIIFFMLIYVSCYYEFGYIRRAVKEERKWPAIYKVGVCLQILCFCCMIMYVSTGELYFSWLVMSILLVCVGIIITFKSSRSFGVAVTLWGMASLILLVLFNLAVFVTLN